MGSNNADKEKAGRKLIFSSSGYVLGLANGRLFGCPPTQDDPRTGGATGADAFDVPDEQGTQPLNEEVCHDV